MERVRVINAGGTRNTLSFGLRGYLEEIGEKNVAFFDVYSGILSWLD